jgi:single-stranded DNA-specific DHH superfamily exonuclease
VLGLLESPHFWRAVLAVILIWSARHARAIFDSLKYVFDRLAEALARRAEQRSQVDQVVVEALRQKLENGDPFDVSFAFTLYDRMLAEKAAQIEALAERNRLLEERLQAMTALAIEKSEESVQVVRLLNGTVAVFNALAERLAGAIERLCAVLAGKQEGGGDERGG